MSPLTLLRHEREAQFLGFVLTKTDARNIIELMQIHFVSWVLIQVLRLIRMELFRTLLMERVEFFDRHTSTELTSLLSIELDSLRSFIFGNVSRDRGLRAILEAFGAVLVRPCISTC